MTEMLCYHFYRCNNDLSASSDLHRFCTNVFCAISSSSYMRYKANIHARRLIRSSQNHPKYLADIVLNQGKWEINWTCRMSKHANIMNKYGKCIIQRHTGVLRMLLSRGTFSQFKCKRWEVRLSQKFVHNNFHSIYSDSISPPLVFGLRICLQAELHMKLAFPSGKYARARVDMLC